MGILQINRIQVGEVGVMPGTLKMVTTDSLSAVTTAGYLNNIGTQLTSLDISPSDVIGCLYSYNVSTGAGTYALLKVTVTNGVIDLSEITGTPSAVIKFAGQLTTVGGSATEAFTITGAVAATDRAFVQIVDNGTGNVTALQAVVTANTLTITFSGNPGADTIFNYQIIRNLL